MATGSGTDFLFRPTRTSDLPEIEAIASKSALRVPAGLATSLDDPEQRCLTAVTSKGVVIAFLRFRLTADGAQWTDLVVHPNFLKHEFKLAILEQAKAAGSSAHPEAGSGPQSGAVATMPGLISGSWKTFVKEQARTLGYHVEEVKPSSSKSLILHF